MQKFCPDSPAGALPYPLDRTNLSLALLLYFLSSTLRCRRSDNPHKFASQDGGEKNLPIRRRLFAVQTVLAEQLRIVAKL